MFKSTDGGRSWTLMGLERSGAIDAGVVSLGGRRRDVAADQPE